LYAEKEKQETRNKKRIKVIITRIGKKPRVFQQSGERGWEKRHESITVID
jgi:hypothetical protein